MRIKLQGIHQKKKERKCPERKEAHCLVKSRDIVWQNGRRRLVFCLNCCLAGNLTMSENCAAWMEILKVMR